MCYDINTNLEAQLSRASRKLNLRAIKEIKENLAPLTDLPIYHATGFSHPKLLIYKDRSPSYPEVSTWGLVPPWPDFGANGQITKQGRPSILLP